VTRLWDRLLRANIGPRVAVIAIGVPCLFFITARGGFFFLLLVDLIILLGLHEFYNLMAAKGYRPSRLLGAVGAVAVSLHVFRGGPAVTLVVTLFLMMVMVRQLLQPEVTRALTDIAVTVLGVMYVGWLASHLVMLRELPALLGGDPALGAGLVYYVALVVWSCDTCAFLVGILVGRRKLMPRISPAKTVEGGVGGLVGGGLAGYLCASSFVPYITPIAGTALGLATAGVAQLGDLVESMLKRDAGLKDSATLIPGHGGVLDRVDSLLFAAPVVYYYFRLFVM
jgi:phosphatidate cytidylyltransferase